MVDMHILLQRASPIEADLSFHDVPTTTGEPKLWDKGLLALGDVLCRCMGALFVSKQIKFLPLKPRAERYVPSKVSTNGIRFLSCDQSAH